ncbi:DUF2087 domain-containing protein [Listeria aquatica]|uniref:DUF2087 domain-containing protein n=1 Tax=Listeria aquatica TaxID=1494960 RepID=A0A841ZNI3_9LIST|nr:DUF2087 domain-containing protein [Listeria aquatica]MBC1520938.1 DUF2087 domain-containing protein [Listeria aquatica]
MINLFWNRGENVDLNKRTYQEVKQGFYQQKNQFLCNYCEKKFEEGQVYSFSGKLYEASQAITEHILKAHGGNATILREEPSKYNTLTEKQKTLLKAFSSGEKDAQIALELELSASTVRHQKFTFREKAKQAKLYLAQYENTFGAGEETSFFPIPSKARNLDDRFTITEEESAQTLKSYFDFSEGVVLKRWPKKQKKIIILLNRIKEELTPNKIYTEKEITQLLKAIYFDPVTLRRYLFDYGFIGRTPDGKQYWLEES